MIATNENFVLKHTAAVHISNKLSLLERKIFNILIKNIRTNKDSANLQSIHIKQLLIWLGSDGCTNYEFLKESLHNLVNTSLRFNILNKDRKKKWESSMALLSEVHFDGGMVHYSVSPSLREALARPSSYAYLEIKFQNLLSSRHSLALWEFCCEQLDTTGAKNMVTPYIEIEQLKLLLGVDSQGYESYKVFNSRIIKKSINEINLKTNIQISSILTKKNGKKIDSIAFNISKANISKACNNDALSFKNAVGLDLEIEEPSILALIDKVVEKQNVEYDAYEIGIDPININKFFNKYKIDEVKEAIKCVKDQIKNGKQIKNIGGYMWKILEQGIIETKSSPILRDGYLNLLEEVNHKFDHVDIKARSFFKVFLEKYEPDYVHWIAKLEFVSYDKGIISFKAPSDFYKEWINDNLKIKINDCGKIFDPLLYKKFIITV